MTKITITSIYYTLYVVPEADKSYENFYRKYEVKNNSAQFSISETITYQVSCSRSQLDSIRIKFEEDPLVKIQNCFASRIVPPPTSLKVLKVELASRVDIQYGVSNEPDTTHNRTLPTISAESNTTVERIFAFIDKVSKFLHIDSSFEQNYIKNDLDLFKQQIQEIKFDTQLDVNGYEIELIDFPPASSFEEH